MNLSGTSPSKNLILTVAPEKPLFNTEPFDPGNLADLKPGRMQQIRA